MCKMLLDMAQEVCVYSMSECVCKCVSLCTFISFNQSSGLLRGEKTDGALMEIRVERCIAFL